jgi:hypothetical protein
MVDIGIHGDDGEVSLLHNKSRLRNVRQTNPEREQELAKEPWTNARILKMTFRDGEPGALITNLGKEHKADDIRRLYCKQWLLEQKYHTLKNKMKERERDGEGEYLCEAGFLGANSGIQHGAGRHNRARR